MIVKILFSINPVSNTFKLCMEQFQDKEWKQVSVGKYNLSYLRCDKPGELDRPNGPLVKTYHLSVHILESRLRIQQSISIKISYCKSNTINM